MDDVLCKLQPELGDAKKIGFENTNSFLPVLAPQASFYNSAKDFRQHQLLQGVCRLSAKL